MIHIVVKIQDGITFCEIVDHPYAVAIAIVVILPFILEASDADFKGDLLRRKFMQNGGEIFFCIIVIFPQ